MKTMQRIPKVITPTGKKRRSMLPLRDRVGLKIGVPLFVKVADADTAVVAALIVTEALLVSARETRSHDITMVTTIVVIQESRTGKQ